MISRGHPQDTEAHQSAVQSVKYIRDELEEEDLQSIEILIQRSPSTWIFQYGLLKRNSHFFIQHVQPSLSIPDSYASIGYKDILVSHVPPDAPTATKVVVVTLNRPKRHNAVNENILTELESAFKLFNIDQRVRAIVLTGAGKSFCVGMDLSGGPAGLMKIKADEKTMKEWKDPGGRVALAISDCIKPTVVAVNGAAAGFGLTSILSATVRMAWKDAKLSMPFARRGLTMESVSAFYLPKLVGLSNAMHMTATGNTYAASDPIVSGLFSNLLPTPEAALQFAVETAADMAENTSLMSTKMMRDLMLYAPDIPEETHLLDSRVFIASAGSPDNMEGLKSFAEKRKPGLSGTFDRTEFPFWPWWKSGAEELIPGLKAKL